VSLLIAHYIAEGDTCPDFEDVDEDVAESEGEEACARHDGDERGAPQVLVDGQRAAVLTEAAESTGEEAK
jgi:hypothetical protein